MNRYYKNTISRRRFRTKAPIGQIEIKTYRQLATAFDKAVLLHIENLIKSLSIIENLYNLDRLAVTLDNSDWSEVYTNGQLFNKYYELNETAALAKKLATEIRNIFLTLNEKSSR